MTFLCKNKEGKLKKIGKQDEENPKTCLTLNEIADKLYVLAPAAIVRNLQGRQKVGESRVKL